jgi:hypothetical protein
MLSEHAERHQVVMRQIFDRYMREEKRRYTRDDCRKVVDRVFWKL